MVLSFCSIILDTMCFNICNNTRMLSLPGGYRIWQTDEKWNIIDDVPWGGERIGPDVDGLRVCDDIIIGHVSRKHEEYHKSWPEELEEENIRPESYFIIDSRTHKVVQNLTLMEWRRYLKKYRIFEDTTLLEPNILNKYIRGCR